MWTKRSIAARVAHGRGGQHGLGAEDVGLHEDRAPSEMLRGHVGLGGEVDDHVAALEERLHHEGAAHVAVDELEALGLADLARQTLEPRGIGERVEDDHPVPGMGLQVAGDEVRADEARAAGDEETAGRRHGWIPTSRRTFT